MPPLLRRPLVGEPLAVDLLNTRWNDGGREVDLLATVGGAAQWLDESGQIGVAFGEPVRAALVAAREAIRGVLQAAPGAEEALNATLSRGVIVRALQGGQAVERVLFADEAWAPAWRAAADFLSLRERAPEGVRQCAGPRCVLYFYDPSQRRRWCSMTACGNRVKARRHYARHAAPGSSTGTQ